MNDVSFLRGAAIREGNSRGRLLGFADRFLKIGWDDEHALLPREENVAADDSRLETSLEVLTLDAGWVPMSRFIEEPAGSSQRPFNQLVGDLRAMVEEVDSLTEQPNQKSRSPFKYANVKHNEKGKRVDHGIGDGGLGRGWKIAKSKQKEGTYKLHGSPGKKGKTLRAGKKGRTFRRHAQNYWDCSGKEYRYTCKGKGGETKLVTANPENKAKYNALYKRKRRLRRELQRTR